MAYFSLSLKKFMVFCISLNVMRYKLCIYVCVYMCCVILYYVNLDHLKRDMLLTETFTCFSKFFLIRNINYCHMNWRNQSIDNKYFHINTNAMSKEKASRPGKFVRYYGYVTSRSKIIIYYV